MGKAEISRDIEGLREAENKSGLFIVEEASEDDTVVFFDVRNGAPSVYGYKESIKQERIELSEEQMRPLPSCVKTARSKIAADGNSTLGDF